MPHTRNKKSTCSYTEPLLCPSTHHQHWASAILRLPKKTKTTPSSSRCLSKMPPASDLAQARLLQNMHVAKFPEISWITCVVGEEKKRNFDHRTHPNKKIFILNLG